MKILYEMKSPFILKMKSFLEDRARYAFVTELHWKDLKLLLQQNKRFSESETVLYAAEITLAL